MHSVYQPLYLWDPKTVLLKKQKPQGTRDSGTMCDPSYASSVSWCSCFSPNHCGCSELLRSLWHGSLMSSALDRTALSMLPGWFWDCSVLRDSWWDSLHPSREDSAKYPHIQAFYHWENHNKSYSSASSVQTAVLKHHWTLFPFSPCLLLHFRISAEYLLVSLTGPMDFSELTALMWHQCPPHPTHPTSCTLNHKSTTETQFYLRPSQKPLSGACRACLQVCVESHTPAV